MTLQVRKPSGRSIVVLVALYSIGCARESSSGGKLILGKWNSGTLTYEFKPGNSFTYRLASFTGHTMESGAGTYEIGAGKLDVASLDGVPGGVKRGGTTLGKTEIHHPIYTHFRLETLTVGDLIVSEPPNKAQLVFHRM